MDKYFTSSILLMTLLLFSCSGSTTEETTKTSSEIETTDVKEMSRTIVFFGNSITAGYMLDPAMAFPALIQTRLDSLELPYKCINAGLSGETTAGGLERVDWILKGEVDVFVLELGANDGLRGLPLNQTKDNLIKIIEKVRTANPYVKIVLAGMEVPPNMGDEYILDFRQVFIDVANETSATLIPFLLANVAGVRSLNLDDGIHPNEEGHKLVMENVWKALEDLL